MMNANYYFIFSKENILRLCAKNMNFYQAVFPEKKTFLENIHKKCWFWGIYSLIFTLFRQGYD